MPVFYETKSWSISLKRLVRKYGKNHRVVEQVQVILYRITDADPAPFQSVKKTKHGETRISKCVKYDLRDFFRLVTIQDGNSITLLFVGNHDDEEDWLEKNRGLTIGVDQKTQIALTKQSTGSPGDILTGGHDVWSGKLIDRLNTSLKNQFVGELPYLQLQPILELEAGSSNTTLEASVAMITDATMRTAVCDVLVLLNQGNIDEAENRIGIHLGTFEPVSDLSDEELIEKRTGTEIKRIPIGSDEYRDWVDSFINSEKTYEWFLFMHPEQERYVQSDYNGPAKLSGVSGSGKTAIAIARAIRLAKTYETERILIVTLNKALADLISEIVTDACSMREVRSRIDVLSYFDLATDLVHQFEPQNKNLYTDITIGLEEHKDEIYREFYRCMNNNFTASILKETHFHLISQGINAESYIAEEFDWIRSTRFRSARDEYLQIERQGRSFPLMRAHRERILLGLEAWEKKMSDVGVIDSLGLTTALGKHIDKIKPKYRSIIVDEAQDFGTTELAIIRKLTLEQENDLFLCGDAAQQVQPKRQNFSRSGINVATRSFKLQKNYRNSREILQVAYDILVNNLSVEHMENSELEISDPEFAVRSSPEPVLLKCDTLENEIAFAIELMNENLEVARGKDQSHTGCIAIAGYSQFEIEEFGKKLKLNVLNGGRKKFQDEIFLSDLEQTKGYEFDTVVIVNCNEGFLPPKGIPKQELYRFVSQFYVAMTRAKSQLVLSSSGEVSDWIQNEKIKLTTASWEEFIDQEDIKPVGVPPYLPDFPGEDYVTVGQLTGDQFIFTDHASGLPPDLLEKICITSSHPDSPFSNEQKSGKQLQNIEQLFQELTTGNSTISNQTFNDTEARNFAGAYLNAGLRTEFRNQNQNLPVKPVKQAQIQVRTRTKSSSSTYSQEEIQKKINDLRTLNVPASTYALLFDLKLRSLEDVIKVDSSKLRSYFPAKKIREIKKLAKEQRKLNSSSLGTIAKKVETSVRLEDAGFKPRTQAILKQENIKFVEDLGKIELSNLQKNPKFGTVNLLEIQRVAKSFGIKLKGK